MRILSREVRPSVRADEIATMHRSVMTLSRHEAVLAFIEVLKAWCLFGATVYAVSVSTYGYSFQ